jgi:hypothetical protein
MKLYTPATISKVDIERSNKSMIWLISAVIALLIAIVALTVRWHRMDKISQAAYIKSEKDVTRDSMAVSYLTIDSLHSKIER